MIKGNEVLPNFILVGAEKCATTWIYFCLKEHPEVYLPPYRTEVHFFDRNYSKGIKFYKKFYKFWKGEKAIGDITPSYIYDINVAELIAKHLPNAKIIFSLRNPVYRCYSDYFHLLRNTKLDLSFEEIIQNKDFLNKSLYYEKVKKYFEFFPREKILVVIFEKLKENPKCELKRIFRFLEVDDDFVPSSISKKFNIYIKPRNLYLYRYIMKVVRYFRFKHNLKYDYLIELIKKIGIKEFLVKRENKPSLPIEFKNYLFYIYYEDIKKLSDLIRINLFEYWK